MEDDAELDRIAAEYSSGRMTTGEIKGILVKILQDLVANFQAKRATITDDYVRHVMSVARFKK